MGILVNRDIVVTCAHVVNQALDRDVNVDEQPHDETRIDVAFPFSRHERKARIQDWFSPGARSSRADFCVLQLTAGLPENVDVARFADTIKDAQFKCCYPGSEKDSPLEWAYGQIADVAQNHYCQVSSSADKPFLRQGFSGGPIISVDTGETLGMVVRVTPERRVGHIRSTEGIATLCEDVHAQLERRDQTEEKESDSTGVIATDSTPKPQPTGGSRLYGIWIQRVLALLLISAIAIFAHFYFASARDLRSVECNAVYQPKIADSTLTLFLNRKAKEDAFKQESSLQRVRAMLAQLSTKVSLKEDNAFADLNSEIASMIGEIATERKAIEASIKSAELDLKQNEQKLKTCEKAQ